jgi:hypothetical protein
MNSFKPSLTVQKKDSQTFCGQPGIKLSKAHLSQDTLTFAGSKQKREAREREARKLGLDPATTTMTDIKRVKLGLADDATTKQVNEEPSRRLTLISLKAAGVDFDPAISSNEAWQLDKATRERIHKEVVEYVVGELPPNYEPRPIGDFFGLEISDYITKKELGLDPETATTEQMNQAYEKCQNQDKIDQSIMQAEDRMIALYEARILGFEIPQSEKIYNKRRAKIDELERKSDKIKLDEFNKELQKL